MSDSCGAEVVERDEHSFSTIPLRRYVELPSAYPTLGRRLLRLTAGLLAVAAVSAQEAPAPQPLAPTHVAIVDVRDGALHQSQPARSDDPATERELELGDFEFRDERGRSDRPIHVWYARPRKAGLDARLAFVLHGDSRTGKTARDLSALHAARHGFIVAAPQFPQEQYLGDVYDMGGIVDAAAVLQPQTEWALLRIERLFDHLLERWALASASYDIIGHSAGGQFV